MALPPGQKSNCLEANNLPQDLRDISKQHSTAPGRSSDAGVHEPVSRCGEAHVGKLYSRNVVFATNPTIIREFNCFDRDNFLARFDDLITSRYIKLLSQNSTKSEPADLAGLTLKTGIPKELLAKLVVDIFFDRNAQLHLSIAQFLHALQN